VTKTIASNTRLLIAAGTVLALGILVIAVVVLTSDDSANAPTVTVREGNAVVAVDSIEAAIADASGRAGFSVIVPKDLPEGYWLAEISIPAAPSPQSQQVRIVTLTFVSAEHGFELIQLDSEFDPGPDATELPGAIAGATVFEAETVRLQFLSMLAHGRWFIIQLIKPQSLDRADALAVLASTLSAFNASR